MSQDTPRGRFVWYDVMTTDPDAAIAFYTQLVGWGTMPWQGDRPYTVVTRGETPIGGVMQLPKEAADAGAPSHWLAYVAVPNVDATAEQAKDLGATLLVAPGDIPDVGRFMVCSDLQGAVPAAFQPGGDHPMGEGPPQPGEFSWHELAATDHQVRSASLAPYSGGRRPTRWTWARPASTRCTASVVRRWGDVQQAAGDAGAHVVVLRHGG